MVAASALVVFGRRLRRRLRTMPTEPFTAAEIDYSRLLLELMTTLENSGGDDDEIMDALLLYAAEPSAAIRSADISRLNDRCHVELPRCHHTLVHAVQEGRERIGGVTEDTVVLS